MALKQNAKKRKRKTKEEMRKKAAKMKRVRSWFFRVFIALIIISCAAVIYFDFTYMEPPDFSNYFYVNSVALDDENNLLILSTDNGNLSMVVSDAQIESIKLGMAGVQQFRPNTHDIMAESLTQIGAEVLAVSVDELKGMTYYGTIYIRAGNRAVKIDSRPSDAVALAVRVNADIYVRKDLLSEVEHRELPA